MYDVIGKGFFLCRRSGGNGALRFDRGICFFVSLFDEEHRRFGFGYGLGEEGGGRSIVVDRSVLRHRPDGSTRFVTANKSKRIYEF